MSSANTHTLKIAVYHNLRAGGATRYMVDTVRYLCEQGHTIDVYTMFDPQKDGSLSMRAYVQNIFYYPFDKFRPFQIPVFSLEIILNFVAYKVYLKKLSKKSKAIANDIDQKKYDVVYVNHCGYTQSPALLQYLKTPSIYCCHEGLRVTYEKSFNQRVFGKDNSEERLSISSAIKRIFGRMSLSILRNFDRKNTLSATKVIANSYFSRETLYRVFDILADVVYCGINTSVFTPSDLPKEDIICSPGRIHAHKGYEWIVRALAVIPIPDRPKLVLGGYSSENDEVDFLKNLAESLCVKLEFLESSTDEELINLYRRAKITAFLPHMEPFGLIPLESMACGTTVVGIREGGVRETVKHGEVGLLVDRDVDQIAKAIVTLLKNDELRREFEIRGREYCVQNWDLALRLSKLEKCLMKVLGGVSSEQISKNTEVSAYA